MPPSVPLCMIDCNLVAHGNLMVHTRAMRRTYAEVLERNVRAARVRIGLDQEQLARRMRALGYSAWVRQTVTRVERGGRRLTAEEIPGLGFALETSVAVLLDPTPDDESVELPSGQVIYAETIRASIRFRNDRSIRWDDDDHPQFLATPASIAEQQGLLGVSRQDDQSRRIIPNPPRTPGQEQPVVAAIVTSDRGVLVGQRRDGKPPWTFIAGEQDAVKDENPADTAVREVKEETGLRIVAGDVIGERVHPKTGRTMIYIAATPTRGTEIIVNDEEELADVKWVTLTEADELLPGMYEPVREHLVRELGAGSGS